MSRWVDAHCHLQIVEGPPEVVLDRYPLVELFVVSGLDVSTSALAMEMADRFPDRVLATVGISPCNAEGSPAGLDGIAEAAPRAAGIGETGLDFYRDLLPRKEQIALFRDHLQLATELDKPVVVHCRDAFREVYEIISDAGIGDRVLMHCWTGGPRWARRFVDLGVTFSFGGPIIFWDDDMVRRAASLIPPERATVESDTPHFCPHEQGALPIEPSEVEVCGAVLAGVWQMEIAEVAHMTAQTTRRLFRVGDRTAGDK